MLIRPGTLEDLDWIRSLIFDLGVSRTDIVTTGFVELPVPSPDELACWMKNNPFFLVACEEGHPLGFFLGFASTFLKDLQDVNELVQYLEKNYEDYVYCFLMGFTKRDQQSGRGTQLHQYVLDLARREGYTQAFGAVVHAPLLNLAYQKMVLSLEFELVDEVTTSEDLQFGIYRKEL